MYCVFPTKIIVKQIFKHWTIKETSTENYLCQKSLIYTTLLRTATLNSMRSTIIPALHLDSILLIDHLVYRSSTLPYLELRRSAVGVSASLWLYITYSLDHLHLRSSTPPYLELRRSAAGVAASLWLYSLDPALKSQRLVHSAAQHVRILALTTWWVRCCHLMRKLDFVKVLLSLLTAHGVLQHCICAVSNTVVLGLRLELGRSKVV